MKKIGVILLVSLLFTLFALPISADELPCVIDEAGLLSSSEEETLESYIEVDRAKYEFDFVIVFVDDIGSATPRAYADDYFDFGGYGYGSARDGILLLVSMAERDWYISTSGSGISYFSDATLDSIGDDVAFCLSDGDYYEAALTFLDSAEAVLRGDYDPSSDSFPFFAELIIVAISALLAFIVASSVKRSMNTARKQAGATQYTSPNGTNITLARDTFLFSRVTKVKIESSSSGGGSSHRSSSGRSHGGRGGKF